MSRRKLNEFDLINIELNSKSAIEIVALEMYKQLSKIEDKENKTKRKRIKTSDENE